MEIKVVLLAVLALLALLVEPAFAGKPTFASRRQDPRKVRREGFQKNRGIEKDRQQRMGREEVRRMQRTLRNHRRANPGVDDDQLLLDTFPPVPPCCICVEGVDDPRATGPTCPAPQNNNFVELAAAVRERAEVALLAASRTAINNFRADALNPATPIPSLHNLRRQLTSNAAAPGGLGSNHAASFRDPNVVAGPTALVAVGPAPAGPGAAAQLQRTDYGGWRYTMDAFGRVVRATSIAHFGNVAAGRDFTTYAVDYVNYIGDLNLAMLAVGVTLAHPRAFQAGHIRSRSIHGPRHIINVVPEHPATNMGLHSRAESLLRHALNPGGGGGACHANVEVTYTYANLHNPTVAQVGANQAAAADFYRPQTIEYHAMAAAGGGGVVCGNWPTVAAGDALVHIRMNNF